MKRQRRLRTRTRTAPRSRARSAEPCTFIMATARRGNAACTINVGFLVRPPRKLPQQRPPTLGPNRPGPGARLCSVVYKVVRIVGVRGPRRERSGATRPRRVLADLGGRGCGAGSGGPPGPGPGVRAQPRRRRAAGLSRVARGSFGGDAPAVRGHRTGSSIPAFTRSGVRIRRNLSTGIL